MKVISLSSGSKGNSTLIITSEHNLLIDVGLSMKQLNLKLMMSEGLDLNDVSIILISHLHTDHIQSFHTIYKAYKDIVFIMSIDTKNGLEAKYGVLESNRIVVIDSISKGKSLNITPIPLNHDSPCFGYMIEDVVDLSTIVFIADNGGLWNKDILNMISNKEYYCIESNYDETLQINDTTRHEGLKRRVLGAYGHSSNVDAMELAFKIIGERTKGIQFQHLSEHCNSEELAQTTHNNLIAIWGKKTEFKDIKISYGNQSEIREVS